ncbi:YaaA family protein [Acholeplasma hippikon]|uniref:Protein of uncharacterized function (DUF328) n=1 Tax=Acholeplasma hippikon TaxID=264636 RepID=A0A449BIG8_9MOLU|nr:YaaA family protein [Acholeplasma hippikon]VEU82256.1 Protein of uncharacterised function (DUF328) [Acholeplasma hippikon]
MIIFISPSKTFTNSIKPGKSILFKDKTERLFNEIKSFKKDEIKIKFDLSDKLVDEVYDYYHKEQTLSQAIIRYGGILYKSLDAETLNFKDNQIFILSAMYGLVPHDAEIKKYRIDFTHRMLGNLYHYWKKDLTHYMKLEFKNEILIDLTSKEFEDLIIKPKYRIDFKVLNQKTTPTVLLKQMRGLFAREIVNKNIQTLDQIKSLVINDFKFNQELSTEFEFIFTK